MTFIAHPHRYDAMTYRRAGHSGVSLPAVSLGLWHNFGAESDADTVRAMCHTAFDHGITYFDLANNYGPPPGSAEQTLGRLLASDFKPYRDELIISSKAGYGMWPGPYGEWGSRKYLLASLNQSLQRLGLDYVDVFYSHRFDPDTPLQETMGALHSAVQSGKALYVGISNYPAAETRRAAALLTDLGTPCLVHQPRYSMFDRELESSGLLDAIDESALGTVVYSPLAQGLLTDRYLTSIPEDSRAANSEFLTPEHITQERLTQIRQLNTLAESRGQSLAQLALSWVLRDARITSAIIGASRPEQITDCVEATKNTRFTDEELTAIDNLCAR